MKKELKMASSTVNVNGRVISGDSVAIVNGRVYVGDDDVTPEDEKEINIEINGNVENVDIDACSKLVLHGNAGSVSTQSGDIECGDVNGSVSTMSGDVDCSNIAGNVSTMSGNIKERKR